MRTLFIICFVVALVLFYSVSGLTQDDSRPTAISSRIAELTPPDKDVPDNPIVLADEIRQINEELDETRKSEDSLQRQIKSLNLTKDRANKAATITHQTSTAVEVTTPAGHAGVVDVVVTTRDGHSVTSTGGFTFT